MTKEELEKEAEEWLSKKWIPYDFYDTECNVYNDDIKEDLIKGYLASAEPREKRIADLERKLEQTEKDLTDYQFNYPKIKDLEKENAELKKRNQELLESCEGATMMYEHLTKAKEIIQLLLNDFSYLCDMTSNSSCYESIEKAEKFLSEVEK